jgi:hypothetical protein
LVREGALLRVHPATLAEVLVGAVRKGTHEQVFDDTTALVDTDNTSLSALTGPTAHLP